MTGPDNLPDTNPDDMLAMDFALGALGRDERRAVELRLRSDAAFRALVEGWQAQLSPLDDMTSPVAPPSAVWDSIAAEITPVHRIAPMAAEPARPSLWNSLALWRGLALAGAAAAAIAVAQFGPGSAPKGDTPQVLVAALAGPDGKPLLSASYDPLRGAVVLTPATPRDDAGKSAELWVIEGDQPPRSLGVIDTKGPSAHVISSKQLKGLQAGATLAISIEPLGGSPTGQPTGPIVATGKLSAV
jgi:anti-sigma-K factor RskA